MSQRALGPQFHVTTPENAEAIKRGGFQDNPAGGGFGKSVQNAGPGVYTASEHSADHWAGLMSETEGAPDRLETMPVHHDPKARVHVYEDSRDVGTNGVTRHVSIDEHAQNHPDIAPHYQRQKGELHETALARAAKSAGYDALHINRGSWQPDETVWFNARHLKAK